MSLLRGEEAATRRVFGSLYLEGTGSFIQWKTSRSDQRTEVPEAGPWGPHTHRERQSHLHTPLPSPLLCRRALVSQDLSGKFLALMGTHPVCEPAYPT